VKYWSGLNLSICGRTYITIKVREKKDVPVFLRHEAVRGNHRSKRRHEGEGGGGGGGGGFKKGIE